MLYTDCDLLTATDLANLDPEVAEVAAAEGIDIEVILKENWQSCADELLARMDAFGGSVTHWQGRIEAPLATARPRVMLSQIVASDDYLDKLSPLQRWMQARALMLLYEAAGSRTQADRYTAKADRYGAKARLAWLVLARRGLPVVAQPFPAPGSRHERGSAGSLVASAVSGGSAPSPASYDVAVTWVSADGVESGPSQLASVTVGAGELLRADISSLLWPTHTYLGDTALALHVPSGWHVYAGGAGGTLWRQTSDPVPIETKTYTLAEAPVATGTMLGPGQRAEQHMAFIPVLQRS